MAHCLSRCLSTGGSLVRILLQRPLMDLGQVLRLHVALRRVISGIMSIYVVGSVSERLTLWEARWKWLNTIQYNTEQYNTLQYHTIPYNAIQYNTIQYKTHLFCCLRGSVQVSAAALTCRSTFDNTMYSSKLSLKIRRAEDQLSEQLQVTESLTEYLYQEHVFEESDIMRIRYAQGPSAKASQVVRILQTRSDEDISKFIMKLKQPDSQPSLAEEILSKTVDDVERELTGKPSFLPVDIASRCLAGLVKT